MNVRTALVSAAMSIALLTPQTSRAQTPASDDHVNRRLAAQEARIQELEAQLQQSSSQIHPVSSTTMNSEIMRRLDAIEKSMSHEEASEDCEWIDASSEGWSHKWGGRIMGDYVLVSDQDAGSTAAFGDLQNYFEFRRVRFFVEGEGYGVYFYKLQVDFEPEFGETLTAVQGPNDLRIFKDGTSIRDAYVGIRELPFLGRVTIGNHKEPFSLEELTSSKYITFMERALPVLLWAPARHVGISSKVITPEEDFSVMYGLYFEDIDQVLYERIGDNQGVDLAGRAVWSPIYANDGRHVVHLGAAAVWSDDRDDQVRFRSRGEVHELRSDAFFDTYLLDAGNLAVNEYLRLGKEAAVVWGPASAQAELFYTNTNGVNGLNDMEWWGAYAYFSYFLTGEHRNYNRAGGYFSRVKPFTNFWVVPTCDGHCAGWGAWEAAVRWSYLDLQHRGVAAGSRGSLNDVTFGLNWYWNPHTRVMFNYIGSYGDRNDVGNNDTQFLGTRVQVDF